MKVSVGDSYWPFAGPPWPLVRGRDPQNDPDPEPCRRCGEDRYPGNACEHCEATS